MRVGPTLAVTTYAFDSSSVEKRSGTTKVAVVYAPPARKVGWAVLHLSLRY